jgi:hypothetical protein
MRKLILVLSMLILPISAAKAETNVALGVSVPGASVGINIPTYPILVQVPDYPVYYDPQVTLNYFFYDGMFWVFQGDDWYVSSWYNGPWQLVVRNYLPVYVLRIPMRYYRMPPPYFHGWPIDAPPPWGDHWGHDWEQQRKGWDLWDHTSTPRPAPLPSYQRKFTGDRYPRELETQHSIHSKKYHYLPREPMTQRYYHQQRNQSTHKNKEHENKEHENKHQARGQNRP